VQHENLNIIVSGYDLRPGETLIIVTNSGINAVPIEVALECKKRGLHVSALTNLKQIGRAFPTFERYAIFRGVG